MNAPIRAKKHRVYKPGTRFGNLTVIRDGSHVRYTNGSCVHKTVCLCDCGREVEIPTNLLPSRKSCTLCSHSLHGETAPSKGGKTRIYRIWVNMRYRCRSKKHEAHRYYSDKGVCVDPAWEDFGAFKKWALANGYTDKLQIDRIDGTKGYSPENCRWVDCREQQNNKCNVLHFIFNGKRMTVTDISIET